MCLSVYLQNISKSSEQIFLIFSRKNAHVLWWSEERICIFVDPGLDWIEQGLTSPPTQYRLSGRQFYRSKDPTNSIKVLKDKLASHRPEEAQNPPGASHRVTSEPLKKEKPYHSGSSPGRQNPTQQADLYKSCIDRATVDVVMQQQMQHNTSVRQDLGYCTLFGPSHWDWKMHDHGSWVTVL